MHPESRMYRPDIDGLRAIAVLSVVLFHAGLESFSGGFVGVDVFFVISGYLITRNIRNDIIAGRFSYSNFYLRRVRRLFPALFFTLVVTAVLGFLLLSPRLLEQLGESIVYAAASLSNFYFWSETGYFDTSSNLKPLLHFWSLAVEEQFYLVWPSLLLGLFWLRRRWAVTGTLGLLAILSLALGEHWMAIDPEAVYYLMPFRIFEFAIGALCVWAGNIPARLNAANEIILACGLGAIAYAVFTYDELTAFPGPGAVIPCLGAALVIYSGQAKYTGFVLRNRLAAGIGLISYSLYLIHWPVLVYYKYWKFDAVSQYEQAGLVVAALLFAILMYKYIEKPFRFGSHGKYQLQPADFGFRCAVLTALIVLPAAHTWANLGWKWRLNVDIDRLSGQITRNNHHNCTGYDHIRINGYSCTFGAKASKPDHFDIVLLGDSHSKHWVPGLHELFAANGISALNLGKGGILPFPGGVTYTNSTADREGAGRNRKIQDYIEKTRPHVVMLSARWALYANTARPVNEGKDRVFFTYGDYNALDTRSSLKALEQALSDTISRYKTLGIHTVLLGQVPPLGGDARDCLSRPDYLALDNTIDHCLTYSRRESLDRLRPTNDLLLGLKDRFGSSVSLFLPSEWLCKDGEHCDFISGNGILYRDSDHLSNYGSVWLAQKYLRGLVNIARGGTVPDPYVNHAWQTQSPWQGITTTGVGGGFYKLRSRIYEQ